MGLLDYFRATKKTSAGIAKERLQILVAHERSQRNKPSYLPQLPERALAGRNLAEDLCEREDL